MSIRGVVTTGGGGHVPFCPLCEKSPKGTGTKGDKRGQRGTKGDKRGHVPSPMMVYLRLQKICRDFLSLLSPFVPFCPLLSPFVPFVPYVENCKRGQGQKGTKGDKRGQKGTCPHPHLSYDLKF